MNARAAAWFARASSASRDWDPQLLQRHKGTTGVSVIIPARDEAATVGQIVSGIRAQLVDDLGLVDELIVIDSDSTDDTAAIAAAHGATVHAARAIRADLGSHRGKGEALWKSQFVSTGEVLVFVDGDLTEWGPHFVVGLLGPLLTDPAVQLVKGFYDRVLDDGSGRHAPQGGRVTELVARPLLDLHWPELSRVVQPLAGEWAIRRSVFADLAVPIGYGVEIATLLDVHRRFGVDAIAQVDLGARAHTHQAVHDLGVMAAEILAVAGRRCTAVPPPRATQLWQFDRDMDPPWRERDVPTVERPPAASLVREC
jgi:glucosyl-3-phosphoglycerate synthase